MNDSELIRLHRRDQRRRGLAASSIDKRSRLLGHFADWHPGLVDADAETVESFLDTLSLKPRSRYTYLSNLHSFYSWAVHAGHTTVDPTVEIRRPKFAQGIPRPIPSADLGLALTMASPAVAVILACAAYAGMRCCEISRLCRDDIGDGLEPSITAHGKGDKSRFIPLHPELVAALEAHGLPRVGPVLRRGDGRPMPAWLVSQTANGYLHGLGIDATVHQLRHWFGTTLYRKSGHNLLLVRDLMGHASVTTTQVYAATDREGAYQAVAALSPV
jgi:integrase/recombinase XerC